VAVWTITIPCHTARLNELLRSVKGRIRLKRRDRDLVLVACRNVSLPPATGKRRVSLQVTLGMGQRRADPDAWWKSLLDALRHAHAIVDDGPRWCELGPVEYTRGRAGMVITLEDLPDA
jgi:Holliday junction resolvase RusA-like endonuclease